MGPPLPQKLAATTATLGVLSILTTTLRCYIMHMWYTITLLTGIHYGTGRHTSDISLSDSLHAMRCWYLCFLAFASKITLAKISAGFFLLRLTSTITLHRVAIYIFTILTALVGFAYFFLSVFQCQPIEFFWTRLAGADGKCLRMDIIIQMTYLYGTVAALTDVTFGVLVGILVWKLNIDRREKLLIAPLLGMACVASYAAIVRMPYIKYFKSADFLYSTVDISLWSTVEVGVSVVAANFATLRPLVRDIASRLRSLSSRSRSQFVKEPPNLRYDIHVHAVTSKGKSRVGHCVVEGSSERTSSLTRSS
ncbi:hypothetical protein GQ44DRAFT_626427 [Phaeosphaeriaceae sp. PMI808]|nr:hypothetical protein GQ44DRAFT_626427 [Phaeosphaeriaceae sp. PMI808]